MGEAQCNGVVAVIIVMVTAQAPRMRVQLSRDTNKKTTRWVAFLFYLVEAAGVEPASASTLPLALHA